MIDFSTKSHAELDLIERIANRALAIDRDVNGDRARTKQHWLMDFTAANNSCPLKLKELAEADDFNFTHDAFGIARHLDRNTGQLGDFFRPRFAKHEAL